MTIALKETETPANIAAMLTLAIDRNVPVESLEKLVALHERMADRHAAAEFAQAMADFQRECPPIAKTSTAKIVTKGGGTYGYRYAELDEIARTVNPILNRLGLSYSWDSEFGDRVLRCTCTVRHVNGHSITASFAAPVDTAAAMSDAQKNGAALTYARRQALVQALGLTTCDPDTDGGTFEPITQEQADTIQAMVEETGIDKARFLKYLGVDSFTKIPRDNYTATLNAIETKRREAAKR